MKVVKRDICTGGFYVFKVCKALIPVAYPFFPLGCAIIVTVALLIEKEQLSLDCAVIFVWPSCREIALLSTFCHDATTLMKDGCHQHPFQKACLSSKFKFASYPSPKVTTDIIWLMGSSSAYYAMQVGNSNLSQYDEESVCRLLHQQVLECSTKAMTYPAPWLETTTCVPSLDIWRYAAVRVIWSPFFRYYQDWWYLCSCGHVHVCCIVGASGKPTCPLGTKTEFLDLCSRMKCGCVGNPLCIQKTDSQGQCSILTVTCLDLRWTNVLLWYIIPLVLSWMALPNFSKNGDASVPTQVISFFCFVVVFMVFEYS